MKCYLLSGFGPVHLDFYDLKNTIMDQKSFEKMKHYYQLPSGAYALPQNLYINDIPLLRKSIYLTDNLTTSTLEQILSEADLPVKNIPLSQVWSNGREYFKGESIVCLSTTFIWNERMFEQTIKWINKSFEKYILLVGGQFSTLKSKELLNKYKEISYIISGDGEESLPLLINALNKKNDISISSIPNLIYRYKDQIKTTLKVEVELNSLKPTTFSGPKFAIPYVSMRGCPYKCKFCAQATTSSFRYLSAERVVNDWNYYIRENGAGYFVVADSTFFIPFHRAENIIKKLSGLKVKWEANMRADTPVTPGFVALLEDAGCFALSLGFESMNGDVLKAINKGTTPKQNRKINHLFKNSKIDTLMSFIVGFPGESEKQFKDTYNYILTEHYGHYSMYVFELENSTIPIWQERQKYKLELLSDKSSEYEHMGKNWRHCGMTSDDAEKLRSTTIKESRLNKNCNAIFYSWQRNYDCCFIPWESRQINLKIEKLIDKLVFACSDYDADTINSKIVSIINELELFGITVKY